MNRAEKQKLRLELGERLKNSKGVILAEYRGLTVEELTQLRTGLRNANAEFTITKNRILKKAIEETGEASTVAEQLKGPLGTVYMYGDVAQAAKAISEFEKAHEKLKIVVGILDGDKVNEGEIKAIADLPSKEVLLQKMLGSILSPHRGLVTVLSGNARKVVQVIGAIKDKKAS